MEALEILRQRWRHWLWDPLPADAGWWHRNAVNLARIVVCVGNDLKSGALSLRAMGLVFTTLLSLVPLIAVSFSVLKGFGVHNQIEPALLKLLAPLGERADEIAARVVGFVDNIKVGVLGAVGVALLLYTAVSLIQKIEEAFNYTWNVRHRRTLVRRFSDYLSVMVIGPLLVFLALGITATLSNAAAVQALMALEPFGHLLRLATRLTPYALVILAFTFIYVLIPNTRVRMRHAFYGGAVAGIVWETVGRLFTAFAATSTNFTAIYSSFAILLLFMIWLYLSWLILLLGSSIAFYRQHPEYLLGGGREGVRLSHAQDERLALAVMFAVVRGWYQREDPPDREILARALSVPVHPVDRALDALQEAGLLVPGGADAAGFLPAIPPEHISVKQVLDAARGHGRRDTVLPADTGADAEVMRQLERVLGETFGDLSIAEVLAAGVADAAVAGSSPDPGGAQRSTAR
ncbi:MAG: YhjD/YihY/BrkB family envelope integrity protein [Halofilum sp. (in: g-proteobacteria)]|nr:YhjD/YihY/BrkB family envelope integrity protein [Halofilum sp. (in: g-proteobacteria)]